MKKLITAIGVVALIAGTSSCKKDYTCTCTSGSLGVSSTINDTKSNAKDACDKGDILIGGSYITNCEIQ